MGAPWYGESRTRVSGIGVVAIRGTPNWLWIVAFCRGQTETIYKNRHPQWTTTFEIDYEYGSECYFSVSIYRAKSKDNESPILFGTATCEVGDILGSKNHTRVKRLPQGKNKPTSVGINGRWALIFHMFLIIHCFAIQKGGVVFCRLEAVSIPNQNYIARFQFQAFIENRRKSLVAKLKAAPDTVFQISKRHPNAHRQTWYVLLPTQALFWEHMHLLNLFPQI